MFCMLFLDDNGEDELRLVHHLQSIADLPCEVVVVTTADAARQAAQQTDQSFDVFLLAQSLGADGDGIDLMQELRQVSPHTKAIIFTNSNDSEAGVRAFRSGAFRHLEKPFEPEELVLILRDLQAWRTMQYERDWLKVLIDIAGATQRTFSVEEMGNIIVQGGRKLGFERARLWLLDADGQTLVGVNHACEQQLADFVGLRITVDNQAPYAQRILASRIPVFFRGQELGTSALSRLFADQGYTPPVGEWVGIPLWSSSRCLGLLTLDNAMHPRHLRPDQRDALHLLGKQVEAALERAHLYEQEQRKRKEVAVLAEIGKYVTNRAAIDDLDLLLHEVRSQIARLMDVSNFIIVLLDEDGRQLDFRLHYEHNRRQTRRWRPLERGLIGYVIAKNEPQLLLRTGKEFRKRHKIRLVGRPSRCWLGVPLRIEGKAVGAIVVQSYETEHAYTEDDLHLLMAVTEQVAGAIQTARLKEEADKNSRCLEALHIASERIMQLAEQNENWLWHITLTMATADYALAFNRAMLFLLEEGGKILRGCMGIGHIDQHLARRDWEDDRRNGMTFETYLQKLVAGGLPPTPVEQIMRGLVLDMCQDSGVFSQVLREGKTIIVPAHAATQCFPATFMQQFESTDYAVVPILIGTRRLGLLIVDNKHTREPLRMVQLKELETFLALVSLVFEDLRQRAAREKIIQINHMVMAEASDQPLYVTLTRICQAVQEVTLADCVLIYPGFPDNHPIEFVVDNGNIGAVGVRDEARLRAKINPGVTMGRLQSEDTWVVEDVHAEDWFDDQRSPDDSFLRRESVRAFIGVRIYDVLNNTRFGVLYINYRTPQVFTPQYIQQATLFASTAGVAIRVGRSGAQIRHNLEIAELRSQSRARELAILRRVLEASLMLNTDKQQVVCVLLGAAGEMLNRPDMRVVLMLREWGTADATDQEASEVRRHYFLYNDTLVSEVEPQINRGITGQAIITGRNQLIEDVRAEPWRDMFYTESAYTTAHDQQTRSELDVLIRLDNQVLGLFNVESPLVHAFTQEHEDILERLAVAAALALDNIRRQEHLLNVLAAAQVVTTPYELHDTLTAVLEAAHQIAPEVSALTIWYREPGNERILPGPYIGVRYPERMHYNRAFDPESAIWKVMQSDRPVWAAVAIDDPYLGKRFIQDEQIISTAAFPLQVDDETVGALFFNYRQPHEFSPEEQVLFPLIAAIAAASLRDALQLDETRQERERADKERERADKQRARLQAAMEITEAVGTSLDLDIILREIMTVLRQQFPNAQICLFTYNPLHHTLEFTSASRDFYQLDQLHLVEKLPIDKTGPAGSIVCRIARESVATGKVTWDNVGNVKEDTDFLPAIQNTNSVLGITIMSGNRLLGVLLLERPEANAFSADDVELIQGVGQQVSLAIDRAQQSEKLRERTRLQAAMAITEAVGSTLDLDATLRKIMTKIHELFPHTSPCVLTYDPMSDRLEFRPASLEFYQIDNAHYLDDPQAALSYASISRHIVRRSLYSKQVEGYNTGNVQNDPYYLNLISGTHSQLAVSLMSEERLLGVLLLESPERDAFSDDDVALIRSIGQQVSLAIERAQQSEAFHERSRLQAVSQERNRLQAAMAITEAVGSTLDLDVALRKIMTRIHELFPHISPCVMTYDPASEQLELKQASLEFYHIDNPDYQGFTGTSLHENSITSYVAHQSLQSKRAEHYNCPDVSSDPHYRNLLSTTKSELAVSLMSSEQLLGVLFLESSERNAFSDDDVALMRGVSQQVSLAIDRAQQSEQLRVSTTLATNTAWAAEIAHEINSEVFKIRNYADWLGDEWKLSQLGQEYVKKIDASANRLAEAARAARSPAEESFVLDEWLHHKLQQIIERRGTNIELQLELACDALEVRASSALVGRVLSHLVRNALEAMQETGTLTVRTQRKNDRYIEVRIIDTGPGVSEEIQDALFKRQVTTHQEVDDRGRGLLFVRWMVHSMGGTIRLLPSKPGQQGATFAFTLPVLEPQSLEEVSAETSTANERKSQNLPVEGVSG